MRINSTNPVFVAIFVIVVVGTIGFFIASIFIKPSEEESNDENLIQRISFHRSAFAIDIRRQENDTRYLLQVYNGDTLLQNVILGTDFGNQTLQVLQTDNGFKISTDASNEISFLIDTDSANFSSLYVKRRFQNKTSIVSDCIPLYPELLNWYGGPEQMDQRYPVQKFIFSNYAYVTKEFESAAIMERYWLASNGFFILIDYDSPLFLDQNSMEANHICFTAKKELPYYIHNEIFTFSYRIGAAANARETHLNVINRMLGKPRGIPNEIMVRYPIWNTWVRYGRPINQKVVSDFADEIIENDFKYSLIDIDDYWEDCYGSLAVNRTTFPNLKELTTNLKQKGFVVAMWTHPFVNKDCEPYYSFAKGKNLLVKSHSGSTDTSWWNSEKNQAAHVDFTNVEAIKWYRSRLEAIQYEHGIDIFKFDGGETSWFPEDPLLEGESALSPSLITTRFVRMAADFGDLLEIRTGWGTQDLRVFVRMLDFDSRWTANNGLKSLIPTLIQFNINGYVFVLPDMIGGNRYGGDVITKELFIRWLQASTFMPALQFSVAPWDFDVDTIDIARRYTKLHEDYSDLILQRFRLAVANGDPVNPPIWWLDPEDKIAQAVDDEYLLGESVLVAPVVEEGKTQRDIYLPNGTWKDGNNGNIYEGKQWIKNYVAQLHVLPYFILQK